MPQSNGQTKNANKVIVMYLHCLTGDRPRQWLRWLPWAEYVFNTAFQSALEETSFKIVYSRDPPSAPMNQATRGSLPWPRPW